MPGSKYLKRVLTPQVFLGHKSAIFQAPLDNSQKFVLDRVLSIILFVQNFMKHCLSHLKAEETDHRDGFFCLLVAVE